MSNQFVAEIRVFGCNFPPTGWAFCNGQLMPISQNTALFSLLGTFYGGDGKSTFALPNLEDNVAVGQGQGAGLSGYFLGQQGGEQFVTLLTSEMPLHNHFVQADVTNGVDTASAANADLVGGPNIYSNATNAMVPMSPNFISIVGASLPHNNMMPFLALNFCIALQGIFPPRS